MITSQDFAISCPALRIPPDGLGLTRDQTRETLNYFREYKLYFTNFHQHERKNNICAKVGIQNVYKTSL